MPKRKPQGSSRPKTDAQILREAVEEFGEQQAAQQRRREKLDRRRARRGRFAWVDRRIPIAVAIILLLLVADGVRRENREFSATVRGVAGTVVLTDAKGGVISTRPGARLGPGARVMTGPSSKAVIELRDGSRIVVAADSDFTIRGLDYNRSGAYRDHVFQMTKGKALAAVSQRFGADSELTMGTPGAVAAVRGTTFMVTYDPGRRASYAACHDGQVELSGNGIVWRAVTGGAYRGVWPDGSITDSFETPESIRQEFLAAGELSLPPSKDPLLQRIEYPLNRLLDPVLSVLGIGRCSWGILAGNRARVAAVQLAARDIYNYLETTVEAPPRVTLTTIQELGIAEHRRQQILSQLAGNRLDGYAAGRGGYMVLVRGKDRARTRFLITREGVMDITKHPEMVDQVYRELGLAYEQRTR